ncbi:DNA polymerase III subunit gamma/tau [Shewanella sp. Isolate8]|uniref:DNA polymerase III subunit gamma/tau n=1 Tax=Shewanella sp. Isolate8 TaxID=2908529 RepID=UPI001EFE8AC5|nr:DNA polymerase III subunit gamma/tau [Shewanella sp. Isolate8]MCG9746749.1 DNA polymerase III subunit gamma/tau [Shewanella sp. Isolate8]
MSYQVLARKWRPATFEQVVGQSHVLHALTNALSQNRLHHAYLFTGTRGVGKTSLARLFAKGLNCEQGVTASPCGQCASCVEIAQGRFVDLIEVDAASRTKVDDTRELLDNVQYRPTRGRFKVYLIDEVHMLSRSSFNALLKTLEEPPEHVKFLLATTDPQRLPVTVLSRCLQFNLKSLTLDEICVQLGHILSQEQVGYDDGAVKLLAKAANGSMRDALSLTDQAIAFGAGQVRLAQVQTMLGTIDEHHVIVLLKALCDGDVDKLLTVTGEVLSFGADPHEVLRSLLELLHQITLTQFAPSAAQLSQYAEQIKAFAKQLRSEQVQLYYQLLLNGRQDLPHAPDPKSGLEMALLRAIAFVPEAPVQRWMGEAGSEILLPDTLLPEQGKGEDVAPTSARPDGTVKSVKPAESVPNSQIEVEAEVEEKAKVEASCEANAAMLSRDDAQTSTAEHTNKLSDTDGPFEANLVAVDLVEADSTEKDALEEDEGALELFAEQQLILSQAQSQGHSPEPESSPEPSSQETSSANKNPVSEASAESKVDASTSAAIAQGDEAALPSEIQTPAESVEQTASIAEQASSSADESGSFYDDLYFSSDEDESGDPSDYEAYLAYQQGQDNPASGDISSSEATTQADNSAQTISAPVSENAPHGGMATGTASASEETTPNLLEDDLLDAVLNARQSLLSDLEEDAAKEDAAKESASKKPLVGAKKPGANQAQPSSEQQAGEDNQFGAAPYVPPKRPEQAALSVEAVSNTAVTTDAGMTEAGKTEHGTKAPETQNDNSAQKPTAYLNDEDRPPWESPEPSQQVMIAPSNEAPNLAGQVDTQSESHARADAAAQTQQGLDDLSLEDQSSDDQGTNESAAIGNHPVQSPAAQESSASSAVTQPVSQTTRVAFVADEITGHDTDLKWYRLMSALEIGGRVRQLAVNAVCKAFSEPLPLVLKPNQKHLAAPGAITQLEDALSKALGGSCQVAFSVGVEPERETPLEIRQRFHRELLELAHQGLLQDENIRWLTQVMQAEMEPDSLSYLPELLGKRGQTIALIDKSNFVAIEES